MTAVPSWYPGEEVKPAPMPLLLVQAFVNTSDLEDDSDLLDDAGAARSWFVDASLLTAGAPMTLADLELARATRASIRTLIGSGEAATPSGPSLAPLRELAATHRPRLAVRDGGMLELENPQHDDVADGLFELLLIIRGAQADGTWSRLRICANPDCCWAFYDRSRNQQGNWCNMAVCGNRLKNRHLRARRR
jgi:predicted RNA-binding Zn ribbon-like protein